MYFFRTRAFSYLIQYKYHFQESSLLNTQCPLELFNFVFEVQDYALYIQFFLGSFSLVSYPLPLLKKIIYFIFGCAGSLLLCVGFLQLQRAGAALQLWCAAFLQRQLLLLWCMGFSSRGAQVQLLSGMWDLPGPGIKPLSPVLTDEFLATVPLGKHPSSSFLSFGIFEESRPAVLQTTSFSVKMCLIIFPCLSSCYSFGRSAIPAMLFLSQDVSLSCLLEQSLSYISIVQVAFLLHISSVQDAVSRLLGNIVLSSSFSIH